MWYIIGGFIIFIYFCIYCLCIVSKQAEADADNMFRKNK